MPKLNRRCRIIQVALIAAVLIIPGAVSAGDTSAVILAPAALDEDLRVFQEGLEAGFSYLETNGADLGEAVDELRARVGDDGLSVQELGIELEKIIALFVDGHAGVRNAVYPGGYLPFLVSLSGEKLVAYHEDRRSLLDPDRPFLVEIDGLPVARWLDAAGAFHPAGSQQYRLRYTTRMLRKIQFLRRELGRDQTSTIEITLADAIGSSRAKQTLEIAEREPKYGLWPMRGSALLPEDIGYLRIGAMREWQAGEVDEWMGHFSDAKGLIVDVRGNGGGSRHALRALFPYLMTEDEPPWVMNIGAFRLHEDREPHHMTARFMYPAGSVHWTVEEREAINELMETWMAEWTPPGDTFSDWHFMVMSRRINPRAGHFDGPVVVLLDYSCFSATDIFVSAFKGRPDVTLVGTPSGGGSALSEYLVLPNSHLRIRHGSMVSYQRSGRLHDGNGTHPDIRIEPAPEFFLKQGRDNQLEAALDILLGGDASNDPGGGR